MKTSASRIKPSAYYLRIVDKSFPSVIVYYDYGL